MQGFLIRFVVIAALGFGLAYSPWVHEHVVGAITMGVAGLTGKLLQLFGAQVTVSANTLSIPGFAVQVLGMCNGVEATLVLWAALLAFPAPWSHRLKGLLIGTAAVHGLNILRIISLLYLGAINRTWFDFAHVYLWEMLIMLDILIVFLVWLRFTPKATIHEATS